MNKEEFYTIFEQLTGIKGEDNLVYNEHPKFDSIAMVNLIAEVETAGAFVDIVDILDSPNLFELFKTVKPED